jgi:hypothetical protein
MNIPNKPGTPTKPPQTRGRGQFVERKYQPTCREASLWEENIVRLAALESYEEE